GDAKSDYRRESSNSNIGCAPCPDAGEGASCLNTRKTPHYRRLRLQTQRRKQVLICSRLRPPSRKGFRHRPYVPNLSTSRRFSCLNSAAPIGAQPIRLTFLREPTSCAHSFAHSVCPLLPQTQSCFVVATGAPFNSAPVRIYGPRQRRLKFLIHRLVRIRRIGYGLLM